MYTLYYYNESLNICTIEVATMNEKIRCPENLFFIALRKNIQFQVEPHRCIKFTDLERLYIRNFLSGNWDFENEILTNFRLQNSYLEIACEVDIIAPLIQIAFSDMTLEKTNVSSSVSVWMDQYEALKLQWSKDDIVIGSLDVANSEEQFNVVPLGDYVICLINSEGEIVSNTIVYHHVAQTAYPYITDFNYGEQMCQFGHTSIASLGSVPVGSNVPFEDIAVGTHLFDSYTGLHLAYGFIKAYNNGQNYFKVSNGIVMAVIPVGTSCGGETPDLIELYIENGQFRHHLNGYEAYKTNEEVILMYSKRDNFDAHRDWIISYSALTIGNYSSESVGNADTVRLITDHGDYGTLNNFSRNTGTFYFMDMAGNIISNILEI